MRIREKLMFLADMERALLGSDSPYKSPSAGNNGTIGLGGGTERFESEI